MQASLQRVVVKINNPAGGGVKSWFAEGKGLPAVIPQGDLAIFTAGMRRRHILILFLWSLLNEQAHLSVP